MATFAYLMPIPAISSLTDTTNYYKTVAAYAPQLYDLPSQFYHSINSIEALKSLYLTTNPLVSGLSFAVASSVVFLAAAEINRNYSQVDRFWSILPTVYNAHFTLYAHLTGIPTERLDALLAASILWSSRLTYNYWRKGGYSIGSEDYRWEFLRKYINAPLFLLFDIVFIALVQSCLLFSITTPTYILLLASQSPQAPFSSTDIAFSSVLALLVSGAFIADQQQWEFHKAKEEYQKTAKPPGGYSQHSLDLGFNTNGLWKYSRHPNFLFEQSFWVGIYTWSCYTTGSYWNWSGIGAVLYLCLFQASTWLTELITTRKYAEYSEYQRRVGKFLPTGLGWTKPGDLSDVKKIEGKKEK